LKNLISILIRIINIYFFFFFSKKKKKKKKKKLYLYKVPLLAKICPRDLITIYKKGSKFRVDFHITGLDKRSIPKFLKGNMSVIVNVLPNEGKL